MTFRNPCHNCLIRACCTKTCQEKKQFNATAGAVIPLVSLISSLVIFIMLVIKFNTTGYIKYGWIISFFITWFFIKLENKSFEFKKLTFMIILIFGPFLTILFTIITIFEKVCKIKLETIDKEKQRDYYI